MPQTTTQPPHTQQTEDTILETQLGGRRRGRGKVKKEGKEISKNEEPPIWWIPEEEYALAVTWRGTSKNPTI